jgi:EpsI family protein
MATGTVLYRRGDQDRVPTSTPLTQFPVAIGDFTGADLPIPQESLDILGQGFFLNREYKPPVPADAGKSAEEAGPVGLFIGYFPTQRSGQSIHSPQNCLPGSGWTFESSGTTDVQNPNGQLSRVGEYTIVNGTTRAEVLYWYQSHGRTIANDYKAKLYMIADSVRYGRSDAALVRIVTPVLRGESRTDTHQRAVRFTERLMPLLPAYIPN